ncbi:MAG: branched-chain amino acid ABC transporter permease [Christensenellaceae bacterium]|nr:branched-chain amino acid ABC transporter permease [Christensenellaceae bacterium]MBR3843625.1 branched-chain amino acid ABC transporter permease [Christensenellaceae bacterium]
MEKKLKLSAAAKSNTITYSMVTVAFILIYLLDMMDVLSNSLSGQLVPICAYIVMALSLNLTVGVLGELSLGHAGFMSVGAFVGVVVAGCMDGSPDILRFIVSMLVGGVFAGIAGLIIGVPVLRLRGDYLAIVTLAFGEIIKDIINCLYVGVDASGLKIAGSAEALVLGEGGKVLINGPIGAANVPKLSSFFAGFILIMLTLFVVLNLINSRAGRAIMALRDNRIAAESVGIPVTKYKLMAFITSAVLAGMAGVLFSMNFSTIVASKFDFNQSILVLMFVVLGGMGNMRGSIIAATVLTVLPELMRAFEDFRMLLYSVVLILVMIGTNNAQLKAMIGKYTGKITAVFKKRKGETK